MKISYKNKNDEVLFESFFGGSVSEYQNNLFMNIGLCGEDEFLTVKLKDGMVWNFNRNDFVNRVNAFVAIVN